MLRLTLNPDAEAKTTVLDEAEIYIGSDKSEVPHLKIAGSSVQDIHVKILQDGDRYLLINAANDPFTSLNGLPFGKKPLKNKDIIQIGDHKILFETVETANVEQHPPAAPASEAPPSPAPAPDVEQSSPPEEKVEEPLDIEALLKEVELLDNKAPEPESPSTAEPDAPEDTAPPTSPSEKEPHKTVEPPLEMGDSPPLEGAAAPQPSSRETPPSDTKSSQDPAQSSAAANRLLPENWRMLAGVLFALITLSTIVCSGVYFRASGKNSQEEKKIAAGIADIAMAMTHAQINNITPNKQNWADPEFIRNNLYSVLSPNLHTQAQLDAQGQFTKYPYILRVYTSNDMNRFVVLAQPAPNLLQWLVHKKTIVIDSTTMEMRKITDLKKLNRLLANPNTFEGTNGTEISRVIKEGSLMSLASLSGNKNHWGFSPPKALAFIRPGAENYIYNAPRYYPFGETILRKAISLNSNEVTSSEVSALQEEMNALTRFPDLVLYTSQGLQNAIEAQKALATFAPKSKFLVGYVKFNNKGYVASSHIFMNEEADEIVLMQPGVISANSLLDAGSSYELASEPSANTAFRDNSMDLPEFSSGTVDTNHPLYLRLHAIAASRSRALTPLGEEICSLLHRQNRQIIPNFDEKASELFQEYIQTDSNHRGRMVKELAQLYQEYSEMPLEEFMTFIDASKLTTFVNETLKTQQQRNGDPSLISSSIEKSVRSILDSETLMELDDHVQEAALLLNLEQFPNAEQLIILQDSMHQAVLEKLSFLLLSPESYYADASVSDQDRTALIRTLKASWVTNPDEYEFFLAEFEHLHGP